MGNWKKPIAERGPKVISAIRQPHAMSSNGNGGFLVSDPMSGFPLARKLRLAGNAQSLPTNLLIAAFHFAERADCRALAKVG
jgi:hypothetical protein